MPYLFTCPHCQTKTLVDDQYSGHVGRCVTCDQPIAIPQFLAAEPASTLPNSGSSKGLGPTARRLIVAIVGVVAIAGLIGVIYRYGSPTLTSLTTGRERAMAIRNLEQIAAALNAYAADHGVYPMPVVRDPAGRAMHSWRVAILPYLDEQQLYNRYDFNRPWDSPENFAIVESMPAVYQSATQYQFSGFECNYQLVTGDRTLFPQSGPLGPKRVADDPTKTALVVEGLSRSGSSSYWTEPKEFDIQAMIGAIGGQPGVEIGSVTDGGAAIATVDGRGHFLEDTTPAEIVRAILTASGGEPLADDVLD